MARTTNDVPDATPWVPAPGERTVESMTEAAHDCKGCDLYRHATQSVMGAGSTHASYLVVGEQPGAQEDQQGEPFVGPAGQVLDDALERAAIDPQDVFMTNAVKHFRFRERGKRRIHQTPNRTQIVACRPWLLAEIEMVQPEVVVLLGASAGQALLGPSFRVGSSRGRRLRWPGDRLLQGTSPALLATIHPSAVLRGGERREELRDGLVADLRRASRL